MFGKCRIVPKFIDAPPKSPLNQLSVISYQLSVSQAYGGG